MLLARRKFTQRTRPKMTLGYNQYNHNLQLTNVAYITYAPSFSVC